MTDDLSCIKYIQKLDLHDGDILVVTCHNHPPSEEAQRLIIKIVQSSRFGGRVKVLFIPDTVELSILRPEEIDELVEKGEKCLQEKQ